jgi:hypothetical protein
MQSSGSVVPYSRARYPVLALAILALLAAMWGGLVRLGWNFPPLDPALTGVHGPLVVSGFLGTLISLERAVALRSRWAFAAPALSAVGALVVMTGLFPLGGALLVTLGSVGMTAIFGVIMRRQPALYTYTMALGAAAWFVGNVVWLIGFPIFRIALWWAGFLILTIVGERLELARLRRLSRTVELFFLLAVVILLLGLVLDGVEGLVFPAAGSTLGIRTAGVGMVILALWLWVFDLARRTVRQSGLTRFIAFCLLSGYAWLAIGGLLRMASSGLVASGGYYDAMLHAVFLGFVMSMIFGHAPIILPAVLGRAIPYYPTFYGHLVLLHVSIALRVIGDLAAGLAIRQWGGLLNVVAVLLFLAATAQAARTQVAGQVASSKSPSPH